MEPRKNVDIVTLSIRENDLLHNYVLGVFEDLKSAKDYISSISGTDVNSDWIAIIFKDIDHGEVVELSIEEYSIGDCVEGLDLTGINGAFDAIERMYP